MNAHAAVSEQWARQVQPRVVLALPFPPSVNHIWKHGGKGKGYKSPDYVRWQNVAGVDINRQRPGCISGPYHIRLTLGRADRRRRDQENYIKAVSDLLVLHRIVDDDSLAETTTIAWSDKITGCRVALRAARRAA